MCEKIYKVQWNLKVFLVEAVMFDPISPRKTHDGDPIDPQKIHDRAPINWRQTQEQKS